MAKITYEDKEFLNKNENIADKNKVNDTDLNEIKEVINQNDDNVGNLSDLNTTDKSNIVSAINEINNYNIYSTTETQVGKWVDGRYIYKKTIIQEISGNQGENKIIDFNQENIVILMQSMFISSIGQYQIPNSESQINHINNEIRIRFSADWGKGTLYLTIFYLKSN